MNKVLQILEGVKSSCSKGFSLVDKVTGILYKGTKIFRLTTHNSRLTVKAIAFTLAETLIVMAVIGVVAALTLPNLNSSTGDKERVAKVKKIYQNLQDAFGRAEAVYGPYSDWFINDTTVEQTAKRAGERISEFMKVSKVCAMEANKRCFSSGNAKILNDEHGGTAAFDANSGCYKFITADGSSIGICTFNPSDIRYIMIGVDIDGPSKGPYRTGIDVFKFELSEESGLQPENDILTSSNFEYFLECVFQGTSTATWIIRYDNADYLQFESVSGSTATCKNGNTVTESHPRCR